MNSDSKEMTRKDLMRKVAAAAILAPAALLAACAAEPAPAPAPARRARG